jgi:acyl-CoA synthetase (AMP-forming)/AMP-acid ligase II
LRALGIKAGDRVAIVMPNGPEMAAAFVAVACWACAAPLNPAYRADEFDFYLSDIDAKALIIQAAPDAPARAVAAQRGIPVIDLTRRTTSRRQFHSVGAVRRRRPGQSQSRRCGLGAAHLRHDIAAEDRAADPSQPGGLGAEHRPHAQSDAGRPLARDHAVVPHSRTDRRAAVLFRGGASIHCPAGFNALKFFDQLDQVQATWYTAVPTMHQMILSRAERNAEILARRKLRFIRSSSASLTAAGDEIAGGGVRLPGDRILWHDRGHASDGEQSLAAGAAQAGFGRHRRRPEVAIMDLDGKLLPRGEIGEIVIRGENVTKGYANNPKANAEAFTHGWFRTGDQGVMDAEGYLSLTGRLKEIINRGGEKIAPREVDDVIMDHPAVAQVVTFAMPHEKLGEEVAAAVVLREGQQVQRRRAARLRCDQAGGLQGAAQDPVPAGDTEGRHRQAAAHRPGAETGIGRMKICVYGAGAIGGLLGARLARAGEDVTLIARGPHLAAMRGKGLKVTGIGGDFTVSPRATDNPAEAGVQDFVIIAVKAQAVSGIVDKMAPLLGPQTAVVMAVNGVPWWYFYGIDGPLRDRRLSMVDPDGKQWNMIGPQRAIGCVVYPAAEIVAPGELLHVEGERFSIGEPDGTRSERIMALSKGADCRRIQVTRQGRHPQRDLGQALGQRRLQPDQRPDRRDLEADLRGCGHTRLRQGDHAGSPGGRRETRHHHADRRGEAYRRRRRHRRAQDLHVAGF